MAIYDNMRVGAASLNVNVVKNSLENVYESIGISCSDVGGLWDDANDDYYPGMEPCGDSTIPTVISATPPPDSDEQDLTLIYAGIAEKYMPTWYDRSTGWDGISLGNALQFCDSKENGVLCPYEAICPFGPDSEPFGGYQSPDRSVWVQYQ
mmetsp:Transcript_42646/g.89490  ORF Transcript_42646/g.89490 Transcript_42646/m.89490 type:complete len:151 (+) Transcript_42646:1521-1973(+)